jgi:outer membrane lipoprotein-sorting protein
MSRVWLRWMPAAVVPVVIAGGALAAHAVTDVKLPDKTPEQVIALVDSGTVKAFSGTIEQTSSLGLPELPTKGPSADASAASALELLTGSHTARVYVDGPTKQRVQVMDSLAERDAVRNGSDLWLYDSAKATAQHLKLHEKSAETKSPAPEATQTPSELAHKILAKLDTSTDVSVGHDTSVAGRSAYDLVLTPKTSKTLVGSVSIAVDAKTGFPLSVDVQARGQKDPAVKLAFTDISLTKPDSALFSFTPPSGTKVTEHTNSTEHTNGTEHAAPARKHITHSIANKVTVTGTDWTSVVQLPAGSVPASVTDSPVFAQATTSVSGGRVLTTSLVNVLLTDDGRVFAGAVPVATLQAAASK